MVWQIVFGAFFLVWGVGFVSVRSGGTIHVIDGFSEDPAARAGVDRPMTTPVLVLFRAMGLAGIAGGSALILAGTGLVSHRVPSLTFFVILGVGSLAGALWLVLHASTVTAALRRAPRGESLVESAMSEGPADAVGSALWRLVPARAAPWLGAAILLAIAAALGAEAIHAGSLHAFDGLARAYRVAVDVIEMGGYTTLALLLVVALVSSLRTGETGAAIGLVVILGLFAAGTAVALVLGLLDGWGEILDWLGRRF